MDTVTSTYEGRVFARCVLGARPYFGRYRLVEATQIDSAWVVLPKSWPTEHLASDDATRAAHFAIDADNYNRAATHAVETAAQVMTLNRDAVGWATAVDAQLLAANKRDALEVRLLGARERHWPDIQLHSDGQTPLRCR